MGALIYRLIIPLTIGFMLLHNGGDWLRKLKRLRFSPHMEHDLPEHEPELRTLWFERIEHGVLAVSFIVLAWTGFALKYPDHWWARPLLLWQWWMLQRELWH